MESVLGRYKNLIFLVGVLFLQVLGLATQVKRNADPQDTRLIRIWAVGAITPLERLLVWGQNGTGNVWRNYFYLRGVRSENRQLKDQIEQMRLEQVRLREDAAQARRLQALLTFKEQFVSKTTAAQVIGSSGSDSSRILTIDKGENDGIDRQMAVVTADGIVGKVLQTFPHVSQVLLINDQSSGVGALLEKSRLQGVLKGTANGEVVLDRVMSDEQVVPGETVLTSGGDQIFPKGLPVGTVAQVGSGKDLFLNIRIKPAANLSKLEEVLVVTEEQQRQVAEKDTVRLRASDILAQRLPSVPDKPATPETGAAVPAGSPATTSAAAAASGSSAKPQTKPEAVANLPPDGAVKKPTASATTVPAGSSKPQIVAPSGNAAPQAVVNKTVLPKPVSDTGVSTGAAKKAAATKPQNSQPKPVTPGQSSTPTDSQPTPADDTSH